MFMSARLIKISELIKYQTMADIGSGHAQLPIYMLNKGLCRLALATELNSGPLKLAAAAISASGLDNQISTAQGSGLEPVPSGVYESAVIAGMGGLTIDRILSEMPERAVSFKQLVLSPHSHTEQVRRRVHALGFEIDHEALIKEDGQFYIIISALRDAEKEPPYSDAENKLGRKLIKNNSLTIEYFKAELARLNRILKEMDNIPDPCERSKSKNAIEKEQNYYIEALNN